MGGSDGGTVVGGRWVLIGVVGAALRWWLREMGGFQGKAQLLGFWDLFFVFLWLMNVEGKKENWKKEHKGSDRIALILNFI